MLVIGDSELCEEFCKLFRATAASLRDAKQVHEADTIVLLNTSEEVFAHKYPRVYLEARVVNLDINPLDAHKELERYREQLEGDVYPKEQLQEHVASIIHGADSRFHEQTIYSLDKSRFNIQATNWKQPGPEMKKEKEIWIDETITDQISAANMYTQLVNKKTKHNLIVSDNKIEEYEKYFGIGMPIREQEQVKE